MAIENVIKSEETKPASLLSVNVVGRTRVLPTKLETKARCPLVTFDLPYITFYYNQKLLLYKFNGDEKFDEAVEKMKLGLGLALEEFYPLAGRLGKDEEGALVVNYDGGENVQGAEVVEAAAEGVTAEDLAENDVAAEVLNELVPYNGVMNLEGLHRPLLAVQFTKLKDGLAVGCAFNHAILDGSSTWHFMFSWAELCRSSPGAGTAISLQPLHDRLLARSVRVPLDLPPSASAHEAADPNGPPKPLRAKVFSFSSATVQHLKSAANSDNDKKFSTFQSLGAHAWKAISRARRLPPDVPTVFVVFADCRRRVDPSLPDEYFGNLIQAVFTATAAGLLSANPLSFSAELLKQAIEAHDAKAIVKRLEEYEAKPKLFYYSDGGFNCVAVGSSPRFKVYDVDFGFGRPARVRSGSNNKFDGMMYLYPGRDGEQSIDVEVTLEGEAMENLEKDDEFLNVVGEA